jgi:hypothetical protein
MPIFGFFIVCPYGRTKLSTRLKAGTQEEFYMKNFIKILGIISLALIIGFSMAACGGDDDDGNNSGGKKPDNQKPGDNQTITVSDSTIIGTWAGDAANGTLVISANSFTTTDTTTSAFAVVTAINAYTAYAKVVTKDSAIQIAYDGLDGVSYYSIFDYTVSGTTLTLKDHDDNEVVFVGSK